MALFMSKDFSITFVWHDDLFDSDGNSKIPLLKVMSKFFDRCFA